MTNQPKYIVVHCTDVSRLKAPRQFWAVNNYHRDFRKFPKSSLGYYGGYHFFYEGDGTEFRYKEDWEVGAHCNDVVDGVSMNLQSIGLGMALDGDIEFPSDGQTAKIRERMMKLVNKYQIPLDKIIVVVGGQFHYIAPHRAFKPTKTCYGSLLANDWAYLLVKPMPKKDEEQKQKSEEIPKLQKQYRDLLSQYMLLLKIWVNELLKRGRHKSPLA